jgi:hypothetical protein
MAENKNARLKSLVTEGMGGTEATDIARIVNALN